MTLEAFSDQWAAAWAEALNRSEAYRGAAESWEGPVALLLDDGDPATRRAVLLDLWHGACRSARAADPDDLSQASYIFQAPASAWRHILVEGGSPAVALLTGRVRLAKGDLVSLIPYASAARELLALAGTVPCQFPKG